MGIIAFATKKAIPPTPDPTDGLKLEADTSPYTGTTLTTGVSALIDDVLCTQAAGCNYWFYHNAYGVDFGESVSISGLEVYCKHGSSSAAWMDTGHDSVEVFKSNDNSTWTSVGVFNGPPFNYDENFCCSFILNFGGSETARYFKVVNIEASSTLAVLPSSSLAVCEILEWNN